MGYTHYWHRPKVLGTPTQFEAFAKDCNAIFNYCQTQMGIKLANGMGEDEPTANKATVWFNGSDEQPSGTWTTSEQISIPWPASCASVIDAKDDPVATKTKGNWFAGNLVSQRVAPINNLTGKGSGSYETVSIDRKMKLEKWEEPDGNGNYFNCCKTAYRPYDLAVTAVLLALKHHSPTVTLSTDGEAKDWLDGRFLCQNLFCYGMEIDIA